MAPILRRMSANVYKARESSMGCRNFGQPIPTNVPKLLTKMLVEEGSDLLEGFPGLRRGIVADVMGVRHPLIDLKGGFNAGLAQLAVNANGVTQQKVARAAGQDGRREALHVAVNRRQQRVLQVMAVGIDLGAVVAKPVR